MYFYPDSAMKFASNVFGGTECYPYICLEIYLINIQ